MGVKSYGVIALRVLETGFVLVALVITALGALGGNLAAAFLFFSFCIWFYKILDRGS